MVTPDRVEVILDNRVVGTLARYGRYQTAFEYSAEWIQDGYSIGGEHATTIAGEGKNPTIKDILEVAKRCGINERKAKEIAKEIEETVRTRLNQYMNLSRRQDAAEEP